MKHWLFTVFTIFNPLYLILWTYTSYSVTGYKTEFYFIGILLIISVVTAFTTLSNIKWLNIFTRSIHGCCIIIILLIYASQFLNPFRASELKAMRTFTISDMDNHTYKAYFRPVGAYGRGMGAFWITRTTDHLHIFEWEVYFDPSTDEDLGNYSSTDGPSPDSLVRIMIEREVLHPEKYEHVPDYF